MSLTSLVNVDLRISKLQIYQHIYIFYLSYVDMYIICIADEFSSQCSSSAAGNLDTNDDNTVKLIATCRAIYAYTPNMHDELQLRPGDILSVYRQQDDGWWLGECNGSVGIFPATYVEIISKTDNINSIEC